MFSGNQSRGSLGTKLIRLRVTDEFGLTAEATQTVLVEGLAPTALITIAQRTCSSPGQETITFDASGTILAAPNRPIQFYEWDPDWNGFAEPGPPYSQLGNAPRITFAFSVSAGTYLVRLQAWDQLSFGEAALSIPAGPCP